MKVNHLHIHEINCNSLHTAVKTSSVILNTEELGM